MSVCCECCVLSGSCLCVGLITRPEESYGCLSVVSVVCCQFSLRRAHHPSRGVLWMSVCCKCCVLSGRCQCVGLITRPEESYG